MSELPKSWKKITLKEECSSVKGKKPKSLMGEQSGSVVPYVDIKAFEKGIFTKFAEPNSGVLALEEDTLMVWDGARSGLVGNGVEGVIGSTLVKINPTYSNVRYLHYFLKSQFKFINSNTKGTGIPHVDPAVLWTIPFPLAPLNEQIRIADKLDSILAKVDKAQARLDKIPAILKRFRQSVLAAATSGELTKEWREERSLLFSDWREFGFSELLFKIRSGSGSKPVDESENGIRILRSSAVRNLAVNYSDHRYLPDNSEIKELDYLSNDDLLFTRLSGSLEYVGNCARVQGIEENTVQYPDRLFCAKLKDPKQSEYLEMYFSSPKFSKYIAASIKSSAGHQRITLGVIKDAKVIIPSEAEQEIIVGRVNKLFAKASRIENQYLEAKARLDRLTQSILAKAFRGELVPQDPNDEPAEKLLERIVAEKEQNKSKKTTRKRTTKAKTAEKE
ncbi:restriction endonuclease subunit S [Vibrio vulnificus]|uniref:restriction endonuclease subunit S n=1 Tax=Vibrio vulnificus TaxID=672 RepID=UPI0024DF3AFF|nr:restriction endonuclease subunit S [Vibrio vulnificus]MDK2602527.1 restriction endonuclease subunit S [Vibrio vulnificus]MDK2719076.1 restriction endonuclease subunit S [Vibrio vulnificus]